MWRRFFALVVLLQFTPMPAEVGEWAMHYVTHGDFAHQSGHDGDDRRPDEHGCTPAFHACGCHMSSSATQVSAASALPAPSRTAGASGEFSPTNGRDADSPPHRPPLS